MQWAECIPSTSPDGPFETRLLSSLGRHLHSLPRSSGASQAALPSLQGQTGSTSLQGHHQHVLLFGRDHWLVWSALGWKQSWSEPENIQFQCVLDCTSITAGSLLSNGHANKLTVLCGEAMTLLNGTKWQSFCPGKLAWCSFGHTLCSELCSNLQSCAQIWAQCVLQFFLPILPKNSLNSHFPQIWIPLDRCLRGFNCTECLAQCH